MRGLAGSQMRGCKVNNFAFNPLRLAYKNGDMRRKFQVLSREKKAGILAPISIPKGQPDCGETEAPVGAGKGP